MFFDYNGNPIDAVEWSRLLEDTAARRVAYTEVGPYRVSTVWLGINHAWHEGPPLIFETMVFGPDTPHDIDCVRYPHLAVRPGGT